jgi:hypothetical protein
MFKKQIAFLMLTMALSTQATNFTNLEISNLSSSATTTHYVSKSIMSNKGAIQEINQVFVEHYGSDKAKVLDKEFEYVNDGSKAPLILASACSTPNQDHDYVAHNSQVQLSLQQEIASTCKQLGYSGVNVDYGTFPGSQVLYSAVENNDGVLNELYHVKTLTGKRNLVMICGYTHGLCDGKKLSEDEL